MSYDLVLFSREALSTATVEQACARCHMQMEGTFEQEPGQIAVYRGGDTPLFVIEAPQNIIASDYEDIVDLDSLREFRFETCGSAHANDAEELYRFLQELSKSTNGVLFDPQDGRLIFSNKSVKASDKAKTTSIVDLVTATWMFRGSATQEQISIFFDLVTKFFPKANPTEFDGLGFSVQKYSLTDLVEIVNMSRMVYWYGTVPFIKGFIAIPRLVYGEEMSEERCSTIEINVLKDPLAENKETLEDFVNLFKDASAALNCIYAGAYIMRRQKIEGRDIYHTGGSDRYTTGSTTHWRGVPQVRSWLTWYDSEVLKLVNPYFENCQFEGNFLRLGELPTHSSELYGKFPIFPKSLVNPTSGIS